MENLAKEVARVRDHLYLVSNRDWLIREMYDIFTPPYKTDYNFIDANVRGGSLEGGGGVLNIRTL